MQAFRVQEHLTPDFRIVTPELELCFKLLVAEESKKTIVISQPRISYEIILLILA